MYRGHLKNEQTFKKDGENIKVIDPTENIHAHVFSTVMLWATGHKEHLKGEVDGTQAFRFIIFKSFALPVCAV